ncbi:hypothetical protein EW146_g4927 [Bondarzewia mesenterica]|uniref:F-box domain-containing protein n=1 Tax=Bondarzewia mesenterica TaxID=1095465 RepID=A0A4S4LT25_9AGAM|nr:hypothetical protein EW146_g4927 [Bondarzewia mesenterica]
MPKENLLERLNDDVTILILSSLTIPDIVNCRKTCRRLYTLSKLRVVWRIACINHVLRRHLPFPYAESQLASLNQTRIEYHTLRALRFERTWAPVPSAPLHNFTFQVTQSTAISEVQFLPGHDDRYLVIVTEGIWSTISVWNIGENGFGPAYRVAEWSPSRGSVLNGCTINSDPDSDATIAVSVGPAGSPFKIEILSLQIVHANYATLDAICTIDSEWQPAMLRGNRIAFGDSISKTILMDWRTRYSALLESSTDPTKPSKSNKLLQVLLESETETVIVVRAHVLDHFTLPALEPPTQIDSTGPNSPCKPFSHTSFGWVEAMAVTPEATIDPPPCAASSTDISLHHLGIAVHMVIGDPWSESPRHIHHLRAIPPIVACPIQEHTLLSSIHLPRGHLRCPSVQLGAHALSPSSRRARPALAGLQLLMCTRPRRRCRALRPGARVCISCEPWTPGPCGGTQRGSTSGLRYATARHLAGSRWGADMDE